MGGGGGLLLEWWDLESEPTSELSISSRARQSDKSWETVVVGDLLLEKAVFWRREELRIVAFRREFSRPRERQWAVRFVTCYVCVFVCVSAGFRKQQLKPILILTLDRLERCTRSE